MKNIVPYEKEIKFGSKIAEISSISLEHELNILDDELEGNFVVSGEYKSHELSVNKESFNYKLPFSVSMTDNIVRESVEFEINDFTYEIIGEDTLKVNIEFSVTAMEKDKEEIRDAMIEEINELFLEPNQEIMEEREESFEEVADLEIPEEIMEAEPTEKVVEDDRIDKMSEDLIIGSASEKSDEFATYHIHIVKSGDTVETICTMYQVDVNTLKEYNNMESINMGDKIIIPEIDE